MSFTLIDGRHYLTGVKIPNAIRMITLTREIAVADALNGMDNRSAFSLLAGHENEDGRYLQILDPDADVGDALRRVMPTAYVDRYQPVIAKVLAFHEGDRRLLHCNLRNSYRAARVLVEPELLLQEAKQFDEQHHAIARWLTSGGASAAPLSHSPSLHLSTHLQQSGALERHDILAACEDGRWIAMRISERQVIGERVRCRVHPPRSFSSPKGFSRWLSLVLQIDRSRPSLGCPRTLLVACRKAWEPGGARTTLSHSGAYALLARVTEPCDDELDLQPYGDARYLRRRVHALGQLSTGDAQGDRQLLGRAAADPRRVDPLLLRGVLFAASHRVERGPERATKAARVLSDPEHEALLVRTTPAGLVHPGAIANPGRLRVDTRRSASFVVPHSPFVD